jgi:NADPH-dependent 2,4-dienoyl-CoA reductase/sulfur reductase-like enzyme/Fe-S-cluster-containing hydrogenase component 2/bacterioferritin-associated ferredoxin
MTENRIKAHPILIDDSVADIPFYWQDQTFLAKEGEMISSALMANGVNIFGHHPKDHSPQGIFCANGQCSQCMVIADTLPVKACMTAVKRGMRVFPAEGLPKLPDVQPWDNIENQPTPKFEADVLIIGGGPAGLSAAIELGQAGVSTILIDDKAHLGGKLVLQTHRFFGSSEAVYAGTRGIDIAKKLESVLHQQSSVQIWENSTAVAVFEDKSIGVYKDGKDYVLVQPRMLLIATGAREKSLAFPGNTLPGVYGAGAFQTLVNRDLVRPCEDLFIIGGGNVGLIAGYHAIQAGIHVCGLVEAAPECGGYKVHKDKLVRSGVSVFTSHTIVEALGTDRVEKVVIAEVDKDFKVIPGTEQQYDCDTVLIAVGLDPVNEFTSQAELVGLPVFSAGDAQEIAEASAAIFSGKIAGRKIAGFLGKQTEEIPAEWAAIEEILKSRPGDITEPNIPDLEEGVFPIMHCTQEIPCDACSTVCPRHLIHVDPSDIRHLPEVDYFAEKGCIACGRCVAVCPGLAVTLVDYRKGNENALVTLPFEQDPTSVAVGDEIELTSTEGMSLGKATIKTIKKIKEFANGTSLLTVEVPRAIAKQVSGLRIIETTEPSPFEYDTEHPENLADDAYICRCERVTAGEIRALIRQDVRDINQIKAVTKASMGACGGKTCLNMIKRMYLAEGIPLSEVTETPVRPVFIEMPVRVLANLSDDEGESA